MNFRVPRPWDLPERDLTPESAYLNRRELLKKLGLGTIGAAAWMSGCDTVAVGADSSRWRPVNIPRGNPNRDLYPAERNPAYRLDRPLTREMETATYNNYYEFTTKKGRVWQLAKDFVTRPWEVKVTGLVENPGTFQVDDLVREFGLEERTYRHRCVEAWAMAVPWTGFPLSKLIEKVAPTSDASYVRFVTFLDPSAAPGQAEQHWYPWPYFEAISVEEALSDLAFLATGIFGHELPTQNGAPWRLVLPWKYGFKSIKAMVEISFVKRRPPTFWNLMIPEEYSFDANVDPTVPHPRWSQARERLIDTGEYVPTQPYNGYGELVAHLYS